MIDTKEEILETLKEILDEVAEVPAEQVTPDASFTDDLELDSLTVVSLLVVVQRRFGIEVPNAVFDRLTTVGQTVAFLQNGEIPA